MRRALGKGQFPIRKEHVHVLHGAVLKGHSMSVKPGHVRYKSVYPLYLYLHDYVLVTRFMFKLSILISNSAFGARRSVD